MSVRLAIATTNAGKVREITAILAGSGYELVPASEFSSWQAPAEEADDYLPNVLAKARSLAGVAGTPALADDSGIEADALGGVPGARSARYAGENATDEDNLRALLDALKDVPDERRGGRFRCFAACATPDGRAVWVEASVEGRIIREPRGTRGFGYDPIFVPNGYEVTTAELPADAKDAISHRGRAFRDLLRALPGILGLSD